MEAHVWTLECSTFGFLWWWLSISSFNKAVCRNIIKMNMCSCVCVCVVGKRKLSLIEKPFLKRMPIICMDKRSKVKWNKLASIKIGCIENISVCRRTHFHSHIYFHFCVRLLFLLAFYSTKHQHHSHFSISISVLTTSVVAISFCAVAIYNKSGKCVHLTAHPEMATPDTHQQMKKLFVFFSNRRKLEAHTGLFK